MKILFVCSGNTGRSPMAEFVMKNLVAQENLTDIEIASAASKPADGGDLHAGIAAKLREEHIPYTKHVARQVTVDDYRRFDKIICMDAGNIEQVKAICDGDPDDKIKRLLPDKDIPWDKNGFATTYEDILRGCKTLLNEIKI